MIISNGLGDAKTPAYISTGVSAAGGILAASPSLLSMLGIGASAVPLIGPIVGGISLLIGALGIGKGCGQTCTMATAIVEKVDPMFQQNLQAARDQAAKNNGCLTVDEQQQLLSNFDQLWNYIVQGCSDPALGDPGKRCISERQRGGKYDAFVPYRDSISSMPICSTVSSSVASIGGNTLLVGGAGLLALILVWKGLG